MPATIPALQEGRYSIEQEFPNIENCSLFQAYDTQSEMPVTIVEVPLRLPKVATVAQREAMSASFAEQAKRLTGFRHKSVVAVRSFFTEAGRSYLVTDPVDGADVASVLGDQKQPFTVAQMAGWADALLDVLNVMHNSRPALVYRNIRPENIVLRADGTVNLAIAGMVCCGDQTHANAAAGSSGGSSIAYSPLEQIWGGLDAASQKVIINKYDEASERILKQDLDPKSDLYSLGATLYKLVTGKTPIDALERSIEMIEGNPDPLKSPHSLQPEVPIEVSDVIMKAMEIKREYRFDSAAIMRQVLKTAFVRVKEREAEEALVQKVEKHDVRPAVQNTPPPAAKKADDDVARKLREAEEKRLEAERRAAEAEKKLRETEARVTETFNLAELEDDVLGLLSPSAHSSEAPQTHSAPPVISPAAEQKVQSTPEAPAQLSLADVNTKPVFEHGSVDEGPAALTAESIREEAVDAEPDGSSSVAVEPEQEELLQQTETVKEPIKEEVKAASHAKPAAAVPFSNLDESDMFAERKSGRGIGLPAMAAAAVVLIIAAVGGWFYFGSNPAPAVATETPAASQPAPQDPSARTAFQPTEPAATETPSAPASEQPAGDQQLADQQIGQPEQPDKVAAAAPAKTKKPATAPTKAPAQKKAVTVDDLINDN